MATISPRYLSDGSATWRLQFRRIGIPKFRKSFSSKSEAERFAREHEQKFIEDPEKYFEELDMLADMREREFNRKNERKNYVRRK